MEGPVLELGSLEQLWFQVSGTLCNLACEHCFISCSPVNHTFELMDTEQIFQILEEAKLAGVKEFYFTGGEPFIHPKITDIIAKTLEIGPVTILTNGLSFKNEILKNLRDIHKNSIYSLEIRVSLDSFLEEEHDKLRGKGTFTKTMLGIKLLIEHDFLPIITVTRTWSDSAEYEAQNTLKKLLNQLGYTRPRLKFLPVLKIGKEAGRGNEYKEFERITPEMLEDYDKSQLLCHHSRIATDKGFYTCPILINSPDAFLGNNLAKAIKPISLNHNACYTCYIWGAICSNTSSGETYVR